MFLKWLVILNCVCVTGADVSAVVDVELSLCDTRVDVAAVTVFLCDRSGCSWS